MLTPRALYYRVVWVPATCLACFVANEMRGGYLRIYDTVRFLDKGRGVDHSHPSVDQVRLRAGGAAAALATGGATYALFKRALYSVLLAGSPSKTRLFDTLAPGDLPPRLTPARLWALLGPFTASASTLRELRTVHGMQGTAMFFALAWALLLAPVAQAKAEGALAHMRDGSAAGAASAWGGEHRKRTIALAHATTAAAERAPMAVAAAGAGGGAALAGPRTSSAAAPPSALLPAASAWSLEAPTCRHPLTQQRLHATHLIPVDLAPSSVGVDAEGRVTVAWPALPAPSGGALASEAAASVPTTHESVFDAAWLRAHAYWRVDGGADGGAPPALISGAPDAALDFSRVSPWRGDAWGARGTPRAFPSVSHDEWMRSDAAVLRGLRALRDVGFVCVEGVPATEAATGAAASRVCMMRETVYGAGVWRTEVRVDPRAVQDTAYTRLPLPAHTDGCYWADPPGVQAFHALRADDAGGGGSLLVDGFAVADAVARDDPAAFALLCAWPLPYHHSEQRGATLRAERPVFRCDASGRVVGVAFNNDDREPLRLPFGSGDAAGGATRAAAARLDLPPTGARLDIAPRLGNPAVAVPAMYAALAAFQRALRDTSLHLWMTLRPGRLLLFNNERVLHGRSAISPNAERVLAGCYLGAEDVAARLRELTAAELSGSGGGSTAGHSR